LRRAIALLLAMFLIVLTYTPVLAESDKAQHLYTMAGFDGDQVYHEWETNLFFERMEERTGISFQFEQYKEYDQWTAAKAKMLETGKLPDVLFKAELSLGEIADFNEQGLLMDLAPLLEEHAPNFFKLLSENEELRKVITQPNGEIVTLPTVNKLPANNLIWVNGDWLNRLNLEMPVERDSFRAVLEAFRDKDPNQNGKKDEIPLAFLGVWDLKFLGHAFGLVANDYNVFVDDEGQVQYLALQPQFREFVAWLHELYRDGLIAADGFTTADSLRQQTNKDAAITYGMLFGNNTLNLLPYVNASTYQVMMPLVFNNRQVYRDLIGEIYPGAFALSSTCPNPEKILNWIDYLYTPEGAILAQVGLEGIDYEIDPDDNTWEFIGDISSKAEDVVRNVSICDSGHLPWLFTADFQMRYSDKDSVGVVNQQHVMRPFVVLPYPLVTLEDDVNQRVNELQYQLGRTLDNQMSRFILGEIELNDENWQAFIDSLYGLGLDEFLTIWQNAL